MKTSTRLQDKLIITDPRDNVATARAEIDPGLVLSRDNEEDIASESVKSKIKEIVAAEDQRHPLSDQKIVQILREDGIVIARRTVAKYREMLGILSSTKRKKFF